MAYGSVNIDIAEKRYTILFSLEAREELEAGGITLTNFAENLSSTKGIVAILKAGLTGWQRRIGSLNTGVVDMGIARGILNELPHYQVAKVLDDAMMLAIAAPKGTEPPVAKGEPESGK